jgi:predicted nucleotidyltransferase
MKKQLLGEPTKQSVERDIDYIVKELLKYRGVEEVCVYGSAKTFVEEEDEHTPNDIDVWVWANDELDDDDAMKIIEGYPEKFDIKLSSARAIASLVAFTDRYCSEEEECRFMSEDAFSDMKCYRKIN